MTLPGRLIKSAFCNVTTGVGRGRSYLRDRTSEEDLDGALRLRRMKDLGRQGITAVQNSQRGKTEEKNEPEEREDNQCAICLLNIVPDASRSKPCCKCRGKFHSSCLQRWLEQANSCPLCRTRNAFADERSQQDDFRFDHIDDLALRMQLRMQFDPVQIARRASWQRSAERSFRILRESQERHRRNGTTPQNVRPG